MHALFTIAGAVAIMATLLAITRLNAVHALLYLIVSLLAVAVALYTLGAPYLAALEVIIYAGAIMVLFVFVLMMLNLGQAASRQEAAWQPGRGWIGPSILAALLLGELGTALARGGALTPAQAIGPREVGMALFGPYAVGVELASLLLTGALVAAYHLGFGLQQRQSEQAHGEEAAAAPTGARP